jgi:hypothetical protein
LNISFMATRPHLEIKGRELESNQRPAAYEAAALTV